MGRKVDKSKRDIKNFGWNKTNALRLISQKGHSGGILEIRRKFDAIKWSRCDYTVE